MSKDKKKFNIIKFENNITEKFVEKLELKQDEIDLKNKLIEIENKLESVENVIFDINIDKPDTLYSTDVFTTVVNAIAISTASNAIAEYFGLSKEDIDKMF